MKMSFPPLVAFRSASLFVLVFVAGCSSCRSAPPKGDEVPSATPQTASVHDQVQLFSDRTGDGAPIVENEGESYAEVVVRTIDRAASAPVAPLPPPVLKTARDASLKGLKGVEKQTLRRAIRSDVDTLRAWWLQAMVQTKTPLKETMTLFWHNHFVTSAKKVKNPHVLFEQHRHFRKHALGKFGPLLAAMLKDPGLLLYLDNQRNNKRAPNENLARELLELFTLGEGHYTEADIKETARALTGYGVRGPGKTFHFNAKQHDKGQKTIFGKTAAFNVDTLVPLLLEQPRCAVFLSEKLWKAFGGLTPSQEAIDAVAQTLRTTDYDMAAALRTLFQHPAFVADAAKGTRIKSPVDLVVGTLRALKLDVQHQESATMMDEVASQDDSKLTEKERRKRKRAAKKKRNAANKSPVASKSLLRSLRLMGQDLLAPPNVKGWPGQKAWLNTATLHQRRLFLRSIASAGDAERPLDLLSTTRVGNLSQQASLRDALLDPAYQVN